VFFPFFIILVNCNRSLFRCSEHASNISGHLRVVWSLQEHKGGQWIHNEVLTSEHGAIQEGIVTHDAEQDAGAGSPQENGRLVVEEVRSNGLDEVKYVQYDLPCKELSPRKLKEDKNTAKTYLQN